MPIGAVIVIFAYAAFASLFEPYTRPAQVVTVIPCLAIVVLAVTRGWHRRSADVEVPGARRRRISLAVWLSLFALAATFLLLNFLAWPRTVYPTLSWLASQAFAAPGVRAVGFGFWLWFGWYLVDR